MQFHIARAFALITMIASVAIGRMSRAAPLAAFRSILDFSLSSYASRVLMNASFSRRSSSIFLRRSQ